MSTVSRPQPSGHAQSAAALVAALEEALLAARHLLAALDSPVVCPVPATGQCRKGGAADLSRRETEVLRLLAAGRSNRDIAQRLYLSPRTVQRHVATIYRKVGAHCRAEATAYALRHDLP